MLTKTRKNKQLLRFGLVGTVNTIIDFTLLFILQSAGISIILSNICSTSAAFCFSYSANKKYTFRSTESINRREVLLFLAVTLSGLWIIQTLVLWVTLPLIAMSGLDPSSCLAIGKVTATTFSLSWNFILYKKIVFVNNT